MNDGSNNQTWGGQFNFGIDYLKKMNWKRNVELELRNYELALKFPTKK